MTDMTHTLQRLERDVAMQGRTLTIVLWIICAAAWFLPWERLF
jgi:hypothetical protein